MFAAKRRTGVGPWTIKCVVASSLFLLVSDLTGNGAAAE